MKAMPNGVRVGDVALLVNPDGGGEDVTPTGAILSLALTLWLESLEFFSGRRQPWVLSASRGGHVLARRTFPSRREAREARNRIAARVGSSGDVDWQAVFDAA